jgi:hypothetical protein
MKSVLSHYYLDAGTDFLGNFVTPAPGDISNIIYLIPLSPDSSHWKTLSWVKGQMPHAPGFTTHEDFDIEGSPLVSFEKASTSPPFTKAGSYPFHIEAVKPGVAGICRVYDETLTTNIDSQSIGCKGWGQFGVPSIIDLIVPALCIM